MLFANDVNKYNSTAKGVIDSWYSKNLSNKTNMLEDAVFCNSRNIIDYGPWNPNGGSPLYDYSIDFKNQIATKDMTCQNVTDQLAVSNNKAKLTYPISMLQREESLNISPKSLMNTGSDWILLSPKFYYNGANLSVGFAAGGIDYFSTKVNKGIRPVVSLASGTIISSGTGSETDPWIVQE